MVLIKEPAINALANRYYLYIRKGEKPIPWNIYDSKPPIEFALTDYFGKVLRVVEESSPTNNLIFYITHSEIDELPSYGSNVVVFVIGDEWYRIPKYAHQVKAIFKCVGVQPFLGCNVFKKPSLLNLLTLVQFLRILLVGIPGRLNYYWHHFKSYVSPDRSTASIYDIPFGYSNSEDLAIKHIDDRLYDIYFSGSLVHRPYSVWSLKYWLGTPKMLSRKIMISTLNELKQNNTSFKIKLSLTRGYHDRTTEDEESYCQDLMNTKICLVPRGTAFETSRLFEGMRYGCVLIAEALPSRWYLDGAPVIKINSWSDLPEVLSRLVEDEERMVEMHQKSLNWWQDKCSEVVVGKFVIEKLL